MITKALSIGVAVLGIGTSVALGAGLTERLQAERMTVVRVDRSGERFFCAEHRRWTRVAGDNLAGIVAGDIVRVERRDGHLPRLTVVRTAVDELSTPEW